MLDSTTAAPNATAAALAGVRVVYIAEEPQARRLLAEIVASGRVAVDIETAPNRPAVERLGTLLREQADTFGALKALRKLKASEDKVGVLTTKARRLAAEIKYTSTKSAGLDPHRARIRLIQIYNGGDCVLVVDLDHTGTGVLELLDGVNIVAHNAPFELAFMEAAGVALGEIQCTAQMARLTLGEHATSLGDAAATYLGLDLDKTLQSSDWNAPRLTRQQIDYAAVDAVVTWRIAEKTLHRLDIQRSAYEIQMGAIPAVVRMEQRGFKIDIEAHARLIEELAQRRVVAEQRYRDACLEIGHGELALANRAPSTPAQKAALLTTLLSSNELARWRKTMKSGALSTKRSELLRAAHYPPLRALVDLSRIDKLMSSFGPTLTALVSPVTGRIHAHYRVAGANTGRATCSNPNLQQIPRSPDDHDDPVDFRALFLPEPDYAIVVADYSSMELRAAAHIYGDPAMTRAFEEGQDLHYLTAARITGKAIAEVSREERKGAKAVNFGAIYGQGAAGLVQSAWDNYELVLDTYEAQRWHATFAQTFPALVRGRSEHYDRCVAARRIVIGKDAKHGVGRIFPFSRLKPGSNGYTHSCNLPVQGACADAAMLALAYVDDRLFEADIDGGPVAWLHDEIVLEVREDQAERAASILKQSMIDGFAETFPGAPLNGLVEPHIALSWSEAKAGAIRTASGVTPEPDFVLACEERVKLRDADEDEDEDRARVLDHVIAAYDGARPSAGVAMSHSASQKAMGAFLAADIGRGGPAGLPEAPAAMTFYEFFAGAGMARAGLGPEWTCLFANDNDQRKGAACMANWTANRLIVGDVGDLTAADLPGVADLAWASPPCQDVSLAGDRAGLDAARSGAFWPFEKLMHGLRAEQRAPRAIVLENVTGLLTSHGGKDFDAVCGALAACDYRVGAVVIDAALFVPQSRERVFIIGVGPDADIPTELVADGPMAPFHPPTLIAACKRQRDPLWWRLPIPPKRNSTFADIIEDEPKGVSWHTKGETDRLLELMAPLHLAKVEAAKRSGKRMVGGLYKRIRPYPDGTKVQRAEVRFDDIAGCLRVPTGGSSRQTILIVEGNLVRSRLLSPREAARLMGLSDDYQLPSNYNDAYGLMGDGVVVPVVRFLAEHILEPVLQASTRADPTKRAIA